jgi:hypothetical protein
MKRQILLSLGFLMGCTASQPRPEIVRSQVTVTTAGQPVEDFTEELIHRATLSPTELKRVISSAGQLKPVIDNTGKSVGLELGKAVPELSLQSGDVVTAIGITRLNAGNTLSLLAEQGPDTSMTFLRRGRAHKTLLSVR